MFSSNTSQVSNDAVFVESVFSTYLYTGNGSTQTITNGIDLDGEGGLVWIKRRNGAYSHALYDTSRGVNLSLSSNTTAGNVNQAPDGVSAFNASGFSLNGNSHLDNNTTGTYASWTFRKQPKFFDVVTYTGNNASNRQISHNLGSVPGCIIVKRTDSAEYWWVYHRSNAGGALILNTTDNGTAASPLSTYFGSTPTSTYFVTGSGGGLNNTGATYVAYLFAHDAGGFGADGTENVISCGSFTCDGSGNFSVNLGYEPQWLLLKATSTAENWFITDNMRGWTAGGWTYLYPNSADIEGSSTNLQLNATGFTGSSGANRAYIYIAIRRPMKPPSSGTEVFKPSIGNNVSGSGLIANAGFPVDLHLESFCDGSLSTLSFDRLRGANQYVQTSSTAAETAGAGRSLDNMQGWFYTGTYNFSTAACIYDFKRASGFFDVVCYTGTGSLPGVTHNLGVTPELKIIKRRNFATDWVVGGSIIGENGYLFLNTTAAFTSSSNYWDGGDDSATVFSVRNTNSMSDASGGTYVAYLFATCPGVSKVGSYTGTGTTQQINCGFTGGARFVLIKRTNSTGDWYVWDSARGIVAGNDPYLLLNSTAAEVTSTDYIDTYSAGFEISSTAPAAINANGGTFIFFAVS